jgi:hypothetical protein
VYPRGARTPCGVRLIAVSSGRATVPCIEPKRGAEVTPRSRPLIACAAALAAAALGTGCGVATDETAKAPARPAPSAPAPLRGEAARVANAVDALDGALRDGEVERLCRPGAIFTDAVVREMNGDGVTCEASVEDVLTEWGSPRMTVVGVSVKPGLATARVRVSGDGTVPLTLLPDRHRWLVSFSNGNDPLSALAG